MIDLNTIEKDKKNESKISKEKFNDISKIEKCNIIYINDSNFAINFKGFGLKVNGTIEKDKKIASIKYNGEIGKADFNIVSFE